MFLMASLFSAFGITVASFVADTQGFQLVMNFLVMPMFFLSGALFPLTDIPLLLRVLAPIDPLSYGVDGMRTLLIDAPHFGTATDGPCCSRSQRVSRSRQLPLYKTRSLTLPHRSALLPA
jgi:ABC-2 type transport system permease protein